ncbi:hypothetical protein X753_20415 [Mesorhizobium sp. LNJC399B00]|nr:hypothetical protein X753_20415 [Mesorhizobium sp. LNJC399B00]
MPIAVGTDCDGTLQILAVETANRESRSAWKDFLVEFAGWRIAPHICPFARPSGNNSWWSAESLHGRHPERHGSSDHRMGEADLDGAADQPMRKKALSTSTW